MMMMMMFPTKLCLLIVIAAVSLSLNVPVNAHNAGVHVHVPVPAQGQEEKEEEVGVVTQDDRKLQTRITSRSNKTGKSSRISRQSKTKGSKKNRRPSTAAPTESTAAPTKSTAAPTKSTTAPTVCKEICVDVTSPTPGGTGKDNDCGNYEITCKTFNDSLIGTPVSCDQFTGSKFGCFLCDDLLQFAGVNCAIGDEANNNCGEFAVPCSDELVKRGSTCAPLGTCVKCDTALQGIGVNCAIDPVIITQKCEDVCT